MKILLPNDNFIEVNENATVIEAAFALSEGLARNAVGAKINGELCDLSCKVNENDFVQIITMRDDEGLEIYRHTCAHVLAQAVKTIFPTCSLAIGPVVENGFYYDIDFKTPISQEDLEEYLMKNSIIISEAVDKKELYKAIQSFYKRKRRYGGLIKGEE